MRGISRMGEIVGRTRKLCGRVKLDLLYEIDVPKPWPHPHPYGQREAEQRAYAEALEQITLADTLGFRTVWCVEHHFREGRSHSPAPEVILGALSQCTTNLRLGFGVVLMPQPFCHPARVAEKVATVDILSGGRVEWGTGRSTPMEQAAFHVPRDESRAQWEEAIRAVVGMWEDEYFEFHGQYLDFPRRMVTPKPVQDPHPPCWMAATSDGSAAVAGGLGLGLLSFSILQPIDRMAEHIRQYREAAANPEPITRVTTNRVAAYTLVHCAESMEQCEQNGIWDSVWWWYRNLAEFTLEWEFPNIPPEERDKVFPLLKRQLDGNFDAREFDEADMIVVGDPDRAIGKMLKYADLGVDQLICYVQFGQLSHESVMRTIELLGTEVIPVLERHEIDASFTVTSTADAAAELDGVKGLID
jgi:alkanesulfonate monooxygenase SsuD/methylene tetrahydromethanopterin reductase-like flavin-dependent oxidoreductase (luciferase family)